MEHFNIDSLDDFTRAYMECALWSSHTVLPDSNEEVNLDDNHDITDIAPATRETMIADCKAFQTENSEYLIAAIEKEDVCPSVIQRRAGHDFWLTRNHHGAGFWDGDWHNGDISTEACRKYGEVDLYIGDDGLIYV